jgi:glycosyltransferase involved in cell wall biosynthesis
MRILHVTHEFPPYEFAGTAIYTYNIVKALAEHHEVFVFSRLSDKNTPDYKLIDEDRAGYSVRFMNRPELNWVPFSASYTDPRAEKHFTDYLDEVRPDVVHFQHLLGMSHTCVEEVKKRDIAVVFTLHDFWAMCPMGQRMCYTDRQLCDEIDYQKCGPCVFGAGWTFTEAPVAAPKDGKPTFKDFYEHRFRYTPGITGRRPRAMLYAARRAMLAALGGPQGLGTPAVLSQNPFAVRTRHMQEALSHADLLITPSSFLRDEFIRIFQVPPDRIIHSANGMKFDHVVSHPATKSDVIRFGFVGSVIPTKGVHVLVEAAKKLSDLKAFRVDIYGAPNQWTESYRDELVKSAEGDPHIQFKGRFDNKQIGRILAEVDVLVVPSIWYENAPLTLNEAAMTKTPVLCSDRGGMLEFVRANKYGRTFKLGDADDLAREMRKLIENPLEIPSLVGQSPYIKPVHANASELLGYYEKIVHGQPLAGVSA